MKYKTLIFLCLSAKMLLAQEVIFRTSVENLRLREEPNLENKIIKTVPKGTRLQWSGIRSEQKVSVDWKGGKAADYWYKVETYQDTIAWVFGKGIDLYTIHDKDFKAFNNMDSFDYQLDNEWIKIETSDKKKFDNLSLFTSKCKWNEIKENEYEKPFSLTFKNGKKQNFNATIEDEPHWLDGELI